MNTNIATTQPPSSTPLSNARHEAFAQAVASGHSATEAYLSVYDRGRRDTAWTAGSRLRKNPAVVARIQSLQSAAAQAAAFDLQKLLRFLDRIITTPISEVTADSDLCYRQKRTAHGEELVMPDKLAAAALAARILGLFRAPSLQGQPSPAAPPYLGVLPEEERLILIAQKRAAAMAEMSSDDAEPDKSEYET